MVAHRYWRINMTANASAAYAFAEIQFRTAVGVSLPFSGGIASAAQVYAEPTYGAAKATDGDINTLWSGIDKSGANWWAYDYGVGNSLDIVQVAITARNDASFNQAPTVFSLEWSDDGSAWTSHQSFTSATWTSGQVQLFTIVVGIADARLTQIALEQWGIENPQGWLTQIALEQWVSLGGVSGKYYFEVTATTIVSAGGAGVGVGVATTTSTYTGMGVNATAGVEVFLNGTIFANGANTGLAIAAYTTGDVIGIAVDLDNRKAWFRKGAAGNWNGAVIGSQNPATNIGGATVPAGSVTPICTFGGAGGTTGNVFTGNFGATAFVGAVPSGFIPGWTIKSPTLPVNTVLPAISGTLTVGSTLTTTTGTWTYIGAPTYTYQWKRNGINIGGATTNTYLLVSADNTTTVTVTVTATNSVGSASATSTGVTIASGAWTPASLTGLIGWWDASVTASLNLTGLAINSVTDQSGLSNTMNWFNAKPTYNAVGFAGQPAIMFAANPGLQATSFPMGTGNTMTTWFVGTLPDSSENFDARLMAYLAPSQTDDSNNAASWCLQKPAYQTNNFSFTRNSLGVGSNLAALYPAPHRVIITVNSSGLMTMYVDGVSVGTPTTTSAGNWVTGGTMALGRRPVGTPWSWSGPMGESGVATGYSDATTVANLDNYLKTKWGLTSTSYGNSGGTGNRTASITVTTNLSPGAGTINLLVDGAFVDTLWIPNGGTTAFITFDFGVGVSKIIDEFKWYQSVTGAQGTYVFGGSANNSTYTEFPEAIALGSTATGTFPVTNTTGYRYYRLRQTAGGTNSGPYLREIEFKIA